MRHASHKPTIWSLQGNLAELRVNDLAGLLNVAQPHSGLHEMQLDGKPLSAVLLSVFRANGTDSKSWPLPLLEAYVRGNDLVATYQPTSDWPFSPQLYWQANTFESQPGVSTALSLLVSVQTHMLDTWPNIGIESRLPLGELLLVKSPDSDRPQFESLGHRQSIATSNDTCCIVSRFDGVPFSYVEMALPDDFRKVTMKYEGDGISLEWHLFADFLEKGVIRRARVHTALLRRENDLQTAAACCAAARRLQLPLTT
ncbi:MAG TPA: hypothetical protein VHE81_02505 [Lacipirellulaceae bacterium]|nr:hypothetical protein [Lacipirellulaceae bacterium]